MAKLHDGFEESRDECLALFAGAVFLQQQIAEALLETIDEIQGGVQFQVRSQAQLLFGLDVVAMAAHQRQQAAVPGTNGIDVAPAGQEVMVDEADDMEAIRHDAGIREVFAHHSTADRSQVHAHHAHRFFACA